MQSPTITVTLTPSNGESITITTNGEVIVPLSTSDPEKSWDIKILGGREGGGQR